MFNLRTDFEGDEKSILYFESIPTERRNFQFSTLKTSLSPRHWPEIETKIEFENELRTFRNDFNVAAKVQHGAEMSYDSTVNACDVQL